ncbi:hypothetical protein [Aliiroseovarius sediminis]|uniref:hypothetical protein n=1 Tax=Aliiroseovarius sediminis TaxID=2925839 RepID=UPI001F5999F4|nr:hypothetical protein [Aliiroseovarius sediminis]MCI2395343.1 hypothetical protein [Aliiroseovarius sediminis]
MKRVLLSLALITVIFPSQAAFAGSSIERACLSADRANASRALCGCIQNVADAMLTNRERAMVAKFFKDPHRSQATRQSDRRSDERFWQKYKRFGQAVTSNCRR